MKPSGNIEQKYFQWETTDISVTELKLQLKLLTSAIWRCENPSTVTCKSQPESCLYNVYKKLIKLSLFPFSLGFMLSYGVCSFVRNWQISKFCYQASGKEMNECISQNV